MNLTPRRGDWRLTAVLLLASLLGTIPLSVGFLVEQPGHLVAVLRDTAFFSDITARQSIFSLDGVVVPALGRSSPEGILFDLGTVSARSHSLRVEIEGFDREERDVAVLPKRVEPKTTLAIDLRPKFGRVEIQVTDAVTNESLSVPSEMSLDAGKSEITNGSIQLSDVSPGSHKLRVQAEGYCSEDSTIRVTAGKTTTVPIALSRSLGEGEAARVILEWKHAPNDLDAHLLINLAGEKNTRHVFWRARSTEKDGSLVASLDIDERKPGGFETITVGQGFKGQYVYAVKNYSRWAAQRLKAPLPPPMGAAEPRVRLYIVGDCKPRVFQVPQSHSDIDWIVIELQVGDDGLISVVPPQRMSRSPLDQAQNK